VKTDEELTTGQAARVARVSIQTIHNWIDGGKLAAREEHQGSKRVRYVRRADLDRFLATLPASDEKV
jgi:predicted site-specific integrase-resolvase